MMDQTNGYSGTYCVVGPPGCGKTHWLKLQAEAAVAKGYQPVICSLTRTAAAEIAGRDLPIPRDHVGTLHSLAYRSIGRGVVAESKIGEWNEENPGLAMSGAKGGTADDPYAADMARGNTDIGDDLMARYNVLRARMTPRAVWPQDVVGFADIWERWVADGGMVDFTGMIERAIEECPTAPNEPDIIMVDEAQDLSRLQVALVTRWAESAKALMLVGDGYQNLYAWAGSDPRLMDDPQVPVDHRMLLGVKRSYRLPRSVQQASLRWATDLSDYKPITYSPRLDDSGEPIEGIAETFSASARFPEPILSAIPEHLAVGRSVMIASSCAYMLRRTIDLLRANAIPFANPWRRRNGAWNPLGRRGGGSVAERMLAFVGADEHLGVEVADEPAPANDDETDGFDFGYNVGAAPPVKDLPRRTTPAGWRVRDLERWAANLTVRGTMRRGSKTELKLLAADEQRAAEYVIPEEINMWFERTAAAFLLSVMRGEQNDLEMVNWYTQRLLADKARIAEFPARVLLEHGRESLIEEPRVYVGTIHSFKGHEADCCYIYPDLSYRGFLEYESGGAEGRDSVIRMGYVGMTRAREELHVCAPSSNMFLPLAGVL